MLTFDHDKLTRRDVQEVAHFRQHLLSIQTGQLTEFGVLHENDGSCCRREAWADTIRLIGTAINPPSTLAIINVNQPPGT